MQIKNFYPFFFIPFFFSIAPAGSAQDGDAVVEDKAEMGTQLGESSPSVREWTREIEKIFSLRSFKKLHLTNSRGKIFVQGSALDQIRVEARLVVQAKTEEESEEKFKTLALSEQILSDRIELGAEYGKGLGIREKLQERAVSSEARIDFYILAPYQLSLQILGGSGDLQVKNWKSAVHARTHSGRIELSQVRGREIEVACTECSIEMSRVRGRMRVHAGGKGTVRLENSEGSLVFIETEEGEVVARKISGKQFYQTQTGDFIGDELSGEIQFQTQAGRVHLTRLKGSVSGESRTGDLQIGIDTLPRRYQISLQSKEGSVDLSVPGSLSAKLDLFSREGKLKMEFPLRSVEETAEGALQPLLGRVGSGRGELRLRSEKGDLHVRRQL
jgi:DUF4097 and DUF4098 domain-containing protein YvlB